MFCQTESDDLVESIPKYTSTPLSSVTLTPKIKEDNSVFQCRKATFTFNYLYLNIFFKFYYISKIHI